MRILIADDHVVIREALKGLLSEAGWEVVGEAGDGFQVLSLVQEHEPDVLVLDLAMPNLGGLEVLRRLNERERKTAVLVLSAQDDEDSVCGALEAGARGYVPKTANAEELKFALSSVGKGLTYISPSVSAVVLSGAARGEERRTPLDALTSREREIMQLLSLGKPNRLVAKTLHISPRTVDSHRAKIMKKLGVSSNAEMVQLALRYGLLSS